MRRVLLLVAAVLLARSPALHGETESVSLGTPAHGSLRNGVSLPPDGDGFVTYSRLGNWLGRQYVNSCVRDTLVAAFRALHGAQPDRVFVVGETGLEKGGPFRPHRSHQNGLSVDIFMPVRNDAGERVLMPTPVWSKFGYALEFDARGRGEGLTVDFSSVAELVAELDRDAPRHELAIERIIVAPEYVDRVLAAGGARTTALAGRFMRQPAWVRHDEHVHVDFRVVSGATSRK